MMRGVAAVSGLVLAGFIAGCAQGPPAPLAPLPLAQYSSVAQLRDAVTTRVQADKSARMTISGGPDGQPDQQFYGVGVLSGAQDGTSMQFAEQVQRPGSGPTEVRIVVQPDATFLKPPADVVLPPRKVWLALGAHTTDPFYQRFLPMAATLRAYADPVAFFAQHGEATFVGAVGEPVDGVRAVRYDLHAGAVDTAGSRPNPAIEQALRTTVVGGQSGVDYSIWLDEDNHPLRTLIDAPATSGSGGYKLESNYDRWGQPVYVGPPKPDQITQ